MLLLLLLFVATARCLPLKPIFDNERIELECHTSVAVAGGNITIELHSAWAPVGVERVVALAEARFFDGLPFFRAIPNFLIQFGIQLDTAKQRHWQQQGTIKDDPTQGMPFTEGIVSYAGYSKDSRSTHLFITLGEQRGLGSRPWEVAIGRVTRGMEVVHEIYKGYGDKVDQARLQRSDAAEYVEKNFPKMDTFEACEVRRSDPDADDGAALEALAHDAGSKFGKQSAVEEEAWEEGVAHGLSDSDAGEDALQAEEAEGDINEGIEDLEAEEDLEEDELQDEEEEEEDNEPEDDLDEEGVAEEGPAENGAHVA